MEICAFLKWAHEFVWEQQQDPLSFAYFKCLLIKGLLMEANNLFGKISPQKHPKQDIV